MIKKKVLIADDHPAVRNGVKNILSAAFTEMEFGEATDTAEALKKLNDSDWDVVILDIDFPGRNGLDVLKYINEKNIRVPVLVFSFHREEQVALRALRSGAWGFLSKDVADEELVTALKHLLSGRKFISQTMSEQLVNLLQNPLELMPHERLSVREFQILIMIAQGKTALLIANDLNLSVSTIHTYRTRILEKMNFKNNAQLTSYVYRYNLL